MFLRNVEKNEEERGTRKWVFFILDKEDSEKIVKLKGTWVLQKKNFLKRNLYEK